MSTPFAYYPSSYRDPSGFIFEMDGTVYRQVNRVFKEHFDLFISSGCYEKLVTQQLLIPHEKIDQNLSGTAEWYTTLKPEKIAFISYPWEWSFDMLKDAALLTLQIAKEAAASGLVLKDATPYNVQWQQGRLVFIDSLSFEKYDPDEPWIAYRQFCESFLAPLLLMHYSKHSLQQLLLAYPEGIPLAIARSLLPTRSRFSLHTYLHIHLHAKMAQQKNKETSPKNKFSKQKFLNLLTSLEILIRKLKITDQSTAWSAYYEEASQRNDYLEQKKKIIQRWINELPPVKTVADLGANDGEFSKLLAAKNMQVIAADADPYCINRLYNEVRSGKQSNIQPLVIDLANPSPSIGVNNKERDSFMARLHTDLAVALALIHHLAIGRNIPFEMIAAFFSRITSSLIIEFVPKQDEKVQLMLQYKKDIYTTYTEDHFEKAFAGYFKMISKETIPGSGRILYLMKKNDS